MQITLELVQCPVLLVAPLPDAPNSVRPGTHGTRHRRRHRRHRICVGPALHLWFPLSPGAGYVVQFYKNGNHSNIVYSVWTNMRLINVLPVAFNHVNGIIRKNLRNLRQSVISLQNWQRLRQKVQRTVSYQLAKEWKQNWKYDEIMINNGSMIV